MSDSHAHALAAALAKQADQEQADNLGHASCTVQLLRRAAAALQPQGTQPAGEVAHPTFTPWDSLPWKPKPIGFASITDIQLYAKVLTIKPVDAEHQVAMFTRDQLQRAVSAALESMDGLQDIATHPQAPTQPSTQPTDEGFAS
jgi:hypothetical protein